jgi:hypothetical protein
MGTAVERGTLVRVAVGWELEVEKWWNVKRVMEGSNLYNNMYMDGGPIVSGSYDGFSLSRLMTCKQPLPNQGNGLYFRSSNKSFLVIPFNVNRTP